ncbi:CinA family protein, partial [Corynebacterium nasicanis]
MNARLVADLATAHGYTVAVAESLTGGTLSAELAAVEGSSDWFAGGLVAYQTATKVAVLGVPAGCPVISAQCVSTMASSLADLLSADAVVSVSGAGGPAGQDGEPPGTTWFATLVRG